MVGKYRILTLCLAVTLGSATGAATGASPSLDEAVKKYYAGRTDEAIDMIRPLAVAGDAEAQYLLGNILYTLANSGGGDVLEDPAIWYRLAAAQDSAPANYALGVIHNNRWLRSHRDEDARLARSYLQRALDLGEPKARTALDRLAEYQQSQRNTVSLSYTNADFSSGRQPGVKPEGRMQESPQAASDGVSPGSALADGSGDEAADAEQLKDLLRRLQNGELPGEAADIAALIGLSGDFESADELISRIVRLLGHIEEASRLNTAPGSN